MAEIPDPDEPESGPDVITDGVFEQEFYLDGEQAGAFLVELGEQLQSGNEITISSAEWELPFTFEEPVELEIEFLGYGDKELEIELELRGARDEPAPHVS
ncbi:amphi-Trp domain-containing protein [Halocalculus aciditolerans]|nr:amphi-Trp domain-containing protein [Halocalculus aciditolerans]